MNKRLETRLATKEKRLGMTCKVFQLKIDKSHLSNKNLKHFNKLFLEAKWLYNHCLGSDDLSLVDTKMTEVAVLTPDGFDTRPLEHISSQMKQSVHQRTFDSLHALHVAKSKGRKVGMLKFKSRVESIPLVQYNTTYRIKGNRIRIQGLMSWIRVNGAEQIPEGAELANATLVNKHGDFWLHVTCYVPKVSKLTPLNEGKSIAADSGCTNQLTLSNGIMVQFNIPASEKQKKLDRRASIPKKKKRSKNRKKALSKRYKELDHLANVRRDIRNKTVNVITTQYQYVCTQNDCIKAWQAGGHGKKIQGTAIGGLMSALRNKAHTSLVVDRFYPSTQICCVCGHRQRMGIGDRVYNCEECGNVMERDWNSAVDIEVEGMKTVPTERRDHLVKPAENTADTAEVMELLQKIHHVSCKLCSVKQEAHEFIRG